VSPLLLVLASCVTPVDQSAGWKLVPVTADAPALAAEGEVEQARGGETVTVVDRRSSLIRVAEAARPGTMRYDVRLPEGATRVTLDFAKPLQYASVDVLAIGPALELPILEDKRVGGQRLEVELPKQRVSALRVVVHHHLRPRPALDVATVEWTGPASGVELPAWVPPGWLAYRHPGGRVVRLCDRPGQPMRLSLSEDAMPGLPQLAR
jgi:hypothetical protein